MFRLSILKYISVHPNLDYVAWNQETLRAKMELPFAQEEGIRILFT
jgi:hypothetical protein